MPDCERSCAESLAIGRSRCVSQPLTSASPLFRPLVDVHGTIESAVAVHEVTEDSAPALFAPVAEHWATAGTKHKINDNSCRTCWQLPQPPATQFSRYQTQHLTAAETPATVLPRWETQPLTSGPLGLHLLEPGHGMNDCAWSCAESPANAWSRWEHQPPMFDPPAFRPNAAGHGMTESAQSYGGTSAIVQPR